MNPNIAATAAQMAPGTDAAVNRKAITRAVDASVALGARLVVLPEESMLTAGELEAEREETVAREWPLFLAHLSRLAQGNDIWIVAGGYEPSGEPRPFNTIVVVGPDGEIMASYRKLHLYDAFRYRESDYVTAGSALPPVVMIDGVAVGLVNCYDLRFPELTRELINEGADVLVVVAAWVAGLRKEDHWETLLRARAIENTCWVVAASSSSADCIGSSMVIDPLGVVVGRAGPSGEAVVPAALSLDRVAEVRDTVPSLANRRLATSVAVQEPS